MKEEFEEKMMIGRNWSELSELLLWMIMGRLNLVDKLRFGVVCKHWWSAFTNCPESFKLDVEEREPWIMVDTVSKSEREFINLSTDTGFVLKYGDFEGATLTSSRDGWLLFTKRKQPPSQHSIFLINPLTKSVINMPFYNAGCITMGTFSTHCNSPNCVILGVSTIHIDRDRADSKFMVTLAIAHPGDDKWIEFHYTTQHLVTEILGVGQHVICVDGGSGWLLEFDLVNQTWAESQLPLITLQSKEWGDFYNIENKSKVYVMTKRSVNCFMLDKAKMTWVELKEEDLREYAFYLGGKGNFMVKGGLKKVYKIINMCRTGWRVTVQDVHNNMAEQDVLSQLLEMENLNLDEVGQAHWIDLG